MEIAFKSEKYKYLLWFLIVFGIAASILQFYLNVINNIVVSNFKFYSELISLIVLFILVLFLVTNHPLVKGVTFIIGVLLTASSILSTVALFFLFAMGEPDFTLNKVAVNLIVLVQGVMFLLCAINSEFVQKNA